MDLIPVLIIIGIIALPILGLLFLWISGIVETYKNGKKLPERDKEIASLNETVTNLNTELSKYKEIYTDIITGKDISYPLAARILADYENEIEYYFLSKEEFLHTKKTTQSWHGVRQKNAELTSKLGLYKNIVTYCVYKHPDLIEDINCCGDELRNPIHQELLKRELDIQQYQNQISELKSSIKTLEKQYESKQLKISEIQNQLNNIQDNAQSHLDKIKQQYISEINGIFSKNKDQKLYYPGLSALASIIQQYTYDYLETSLSAGAYKAAETVKYLKDQNKQLLSEKLLYQNLVNSYEELFPWLESFNEINVNEAIEYVRKTNNNDDYEKNIKKWLSPEEYVKLSSVQKNQLALDRYKNRPKSDWEIGIEYERYIGYLYETKGYKVKYTGALDGIYDMGRDLIARKGNEILVIQCKRWSTSKQIHEKHIFQLFGTCFALHVQDPSSTYIPVFYTTTALSDVASKCASELNVVVYENFSFNEYPLIKCNLGYNEYGKHEKIYHLPFDQQYDRIVIDPNKGEKYFFTILEAEKAGFRKAMRHYK